MGPEGFQRAIGKPFGRLRRGETFWDTGKARRALFPCLVQEICSLWKVSSACNRWAPEGVRGRAESPLVASAEAKPFGIREKQGRLFSLAFHKKPVSCGRFRPPAGGRGTFPHGKVPKGCRGRPKGACLMAAPGPPVAKLQCTASLAGARPARLTSVPGRATRLQGWLSLRESQC